MHIDGKVYDFVVLFMSFLTCVGKKSQNPGTFWGLPPQGIGAGIVLPTGEVLALRVGDGTSLGSFRGALQLIARGTCKSCNPRSV